MKLRTFSLLAEVEKLEKIVISLGVGDQVIKGKMSVADIDAVFTTWVQTSIRYYGSKNFNYKISMSIYKHFSIVEKNNKTTTVFCS